jgi:hypothetical protein
VFNNGNYFGDFSEEALTKGICKLITQKTLSLLQYYATLHKEFNKLLNPYANSNILQNISVKIFDDFNEKGIASGVDRLVDTMLREHLFYYKVKPANLSTSLFGDFTEEDIILAITQIIDSRLSEFYASSINIHSNKKNKTQAEHSNTANQYVYILYNEILYQEYNTHIYKIGWTSRTPQIRANEISQGTGVVGKWKVGHQWKVKDGYWLEQEIFRHFAQYRLPYSEQFNFKGQTLEQVADQISNFISNHGESPKCAEETAKKQKQQELDQAQKAYQKQLKKIEADKFYFGECKRIKVEISLKIHSLIQKEMEPIWTKRKQTNVWYYVAAGYFIIPWAIEDSNSWIQGLTGGLFITLIVGFILSKFFEDKKNEQSIKAKYLKYQNLPDDLEQLKKFKMI